MLLQKLVEYSHRPEMGSISPAGYNADPVYYWVELRADGSLESIIPAPIDGGKRPKLVDMPTLVRTTSVKAKLLGDKADYVFGLEAEGSKPDRVAQCHRAFVDLVRACWEETREPDVALVLAFLETMDPVILQFPEGFDGSRLIGFHVAGRNPAASPSVQEFWARHATEGTSMQCLVCGRPRPAMERLQLKLKGVPGGQTSGLALISANSNAFLSYGLEASYIAPTCQECGDRFMKAANRLIADENTHLYLGNTVYVFWTREPTAFSFLSMLKAPDQGAVRDLMLSLYRTRPSRLDSTPFYAAALTASGSRAVVRDWIDTTVGGAQTHLARYFALQRITPQWVSEGETLPLFRLASSTTRTGSKDAPAPNVSAALVRCALAGGPLPMSILFRAVERCRLEQGVNQARASLIKMVLLSRRSDGSVLEGETAMVEMDPEIQDPAYLCGRLLAELEAVQYAALGDVGANIVDRYYGTASSAPATVFGRLLRGAQPHLAKLRRDRPGAYHGLDERLQTILSGMQTFPTTLTLEQQGVFALGYYHQRASDRAARAAARSTTTAKTAIEEVQA